MAFSLPSKKTPSLWKTFLSRRFNTKKWCLIRPRNKTKWRLNSQTLRRTLRCLELILKPSRVRIRLLCSRSRRCSNKLSTTCSHKKLAFLQAVLAEKMKWLSSAIIWVSFWPRNLRDKITWEISGGKFQPLLLTSNSKLRSLVPTSKFWLRRTQSSRERSSASRKRRNHKNSSASWKTKKWKIMSLSWCNHRVELNSSRRNLTSLLTEAITNTTSWDKKSESRTRSSLHLTRRSITWPIRATWFSDPNSTKTKETLKDFVILAKLKVL